MKEKVCLLQREDGDDEESLPVVGMEDSVFRESCGADAASDNGSVNDNSTRGNNVEGASESE